MLTPILGEPLALLIGGALLLALCIGFGLFMRWITRPAARTPEPDPAPSITWRKVNDPWEDAG